MLTFLRIINNLDFTVQIIIAAVLAVLQIPRKRNFALRFTGCTVISLAVSIVWDFYYAFSLSVAAGVVFNVLRYMVLLFITGATIKICWECSVSQTIFRICTAYCMQHFAYVATEMVYIILFYTVEGYGTEDYYDTGGFYGIHYAVMIPVFAAMYAVLYFSFFRRINILQKSMSFTGLVAPSLLLIISTMFLNTMRLYDVLAPWVLILYPIALCGMGLFFFMTLFRNNRLQSEVESMELMMQMQRNYAEVSKETIDIINMRCHDIRHQLASLAGATEDPEVQKQASDLREEVSFYEGVEKTGCEALDIILSEKHFFCKSKGIDLSCIVDEGSLADIPADDIYSLFGNALDNAVDAVLQLPEDKRVISFQVKRNGNIIKMRCDNYYDGVISFGRDKLPLSSKTERGAVHGLGIKSMRYIAQKYNGDISVRAEGGIFSLSAVLIPGSSGHEQRQLAA